MEYQTEEGKPINVDEMASSLGRNAIIYLNKANQIYEILKTFQDCGYEQKIVMEFVEVLFKAH